MPRRYVERASALRSLRKGIERGQAEPLSPPGRLKRDGTSIPHSWKLNFAQKCQTPVTILRDGVRLLKGKPSHIFGPGSERPVMTELEVPCRKCDACLKQRAAHWRLRAYSEWQGSERTWFGTLTLTPANHYRMAAAARVRASRNGDDFDTFPPEQRFAELHREISREITLFVKRIRKESGAELRLLCVAEAHKSGLPHYHMLVHEVRPDEPILHKVLESQWRLGFSNWKLVQDAKAAGYCTKYLAKSSMARVRASVDYGKAQRPSDIA